MPIFVRYIWLSLLLFLSCSTPLPDNSISIFANWFINSDNAAKSQFSRFSLDHHTLDSLTTHQRKRKIEPTKAYITLRDIKGVEFVSGYATPTQLDKGAEYPLLIYLHGGIGTQKSDKGKMAFDMFTFLADSMDLFLASPSGNRQAPWWSECGIDRILKTVRYMTMQFPIDPDRIFLAGVSDGAAGCYAAANAICGPFAGFIAISGFGGILPQLQINPNPTNLRIRPIYNINAGKDHLYPVDLVQQFLKWARENGIPIIDTLYPKEKHGFDYKENERASLVRYITKWKRIDRDAYSWTFVPKVTNLPDNILDWTPKHASSEQRIAAFWQKDTLLVQSTGIESLTMITDKGRGKKLFYRSNNGTTKKITFLKDNTELQLSLMHHYCRPGYIDRQVFVVSTTEP